MILDEAIVHAREVAEEQRKACNLAWVWSNPENIKKCAEEHEQLAEWLEELKEYKEVGTPEECRVAVEVTKSMLKRNFTKEIVTEYMKFEDECVKQGFSFNSILEAREKQKAKTPIRNDKCTCPSCGTHNEVFKKRRNTVAHDIVYCWHCGQAVEIDRLEE